MKPIRHTTLLHYLSIGAIAMTATEGEPRPSEQRIDAVAPLLAQQPAGFGRPVGDRDAWDPLAKHQSYAGIVAKAEALLKEPIPEQPDDLSLDFSRTGNRTRWQRVSGQRRGRISAFVLAECVGNKGRFIGAIERNTRRASCEASPAMGTAPRDWATGTMGSVTM